MDKKSHNISYVEYQGLTEVPKELGNLVVEASKAYYAAYAPYSNFKVGAAVLMGNGEVVTGTNQENAAYPSGLCAERVALFAAHSQFPDSEVVAVAISTENKSEPVPPCGACRQVIAESQQRGGQPIDILIGNPDGKILHFSGSETLLPFHFNSDYLS